MARSSAQLGRGRLSVAKCFFLIIYITLVSCSEAESRQKQPLTVSKRGTTPETKAEEALEQALIPDNSTKAVMLSDQDDAMASLNLSLPVLAQRLLVDAKEAAAAAARNAPSLPLLPKGSVITYTYGGCDASSHTGLGAEQIYSGAGTRQWRSRHPPSQLINTPHSRAPRNLSAPHSPPPSPHL
jgi:hypothetical protein